MLFSLPGIHYPTHRPSLSLSSPCVKTLLPTFRRSRVHLCLLCALLLLKHGFLMSLYPQYGSYCSHISRPCCSFELRPGKDPMLFDFLPPGPSIFSFAIGLESSLFSLKWSISTHTEFSWRQRSKAREVGCTKYKETDTSWHKRHDSIHLWNFSWLCAVGEK